MPRRLVAIVMIVSAGMLAIGTLRDPKAASATVSPPAFGIVGVDGTHLAAERAAGVSTLLFEIRWSDYEPQQGIVDQAYLSAARSRLAAMRQAGFRVVLEAGLASTPTWVFALDGNTRFVNQYGDVYHGLSAGDPANGVFDSSVRSAQAGYIAQLAHDFGDVFDTIRVGGLEDDELRYPGPSYNGHSNSYWSFDADAQAASPVPGWRPGQAGTTQASSFLDYYLQGLTGYQNWLIGAYRSHFSAWLQVLYPSWGLRPPWPTRPGWSGRTTASTPCTRARPGT
ncbi:MAG: hypothetical protein E6J20_20355 [Chloroflexi bacterium]|nr:MAG: hypothetical protein E6J20_20355 [Chloroflexota bacterium]